MPQAATWRRQRQRHDIAASQKAQYRTCAHQTWKSRMRTRSNARPASRVNPTLRKNDKIQPVPSLSPSFWIPLALMHYSDAEMREPFRAGWMGVKSQAKGTALALRDTREAKWCCYMTQTDKMTWRLQLHWLGNSKRQFSKLLLQIVLCLRLKWMRMRTTTGWNL